jgi:hypothetical protein
MGHQQLPVKEQQLAVLTGGLQDMQPAAALAADGQEQQQQKRQGSILLNVCFWVWLVIGSAIYLAVLAGTIAIVYVAKQRQ